jgi:heme-degrading monooxygenase HmoA
MRQACRTPAPPYWAVIFSSRHDPDYGEYAAMAERMAARSAAMPGFLGMEHAGAPDGFAITVCYWDSPEAVAGWRRDVEHAEAQRLGRERFYEYFELRVAKVERAHGFDRDGA